MSSFQISCKKCHGEIDENDGFSLVDFKDFLCSSCSGNESLLQAIHIKPFAVCAFNKRCKKRAILKCPCNGMNYCKSCHVKYCEQDPDTSECDPVILVHGSLCSSCGGPSFYVDSNKEFKCGDCIQGLENVDSLVDQDLATLNQVIQSLCSQCHVRKHENSSIIKKMKVNIKNITTVMKTADEADMEFNLALDSNREKLKINIAKNAKLSEIIANFSPESKVINVYIAVMKQRRVNHNQALDYLQGVETIVNNELTVINTVNKLKFTFEEAALVASQPLDNNESSDAALVHDDDPTCHSLLSSQELPGPIMENFNDNENYIECIYHRGPFWLVFVEPSLIKKRDENLKELRNYQGNMMNEKSIKVGAHVILQDEIQFGNEDRWKRSLVTRHGYGSGWWCVTLLDFGKSLYVFKNKIFEIPASLDNQEATFFISQLMGIKPVSNFAFSTVCSPNAISIIKDKLLPSNGMVRVTIKYNIGDVKFCIVKSDVRGQEIDWSQAMVNEKVALPFRDNMSCFIPDMQYCYFYHVLNQCRNARCPRSHICSFCKNGNHRFVKCSAYTEAEARLIMSMEE